MPIIRPTKPTTSKAFYEAAVSMNSKMERNAKRAEVLASKKEKELLRENQAFIEAGMKRDAAQRRYADFSESVKSRLLGAAIEDIAIGAMQKVNESLNREFFTHNDICNINAITFSFIHENGEASTLLYNMSKGPNTLFLSELSKNIKSTLKGILTEGIDATDPNTYTIGDQVMSDYKDKVKGEFGHDELIDSIAQRVADAIKNFITQNAEDKQKIIDAMTATKEKVDSLKDAPDAVKESYMNIGRKYITNIRESKKGLFNEMVMSMSKGIVKTENTSIKDTFMEGAHINMGKVVQSVATMYTFLETVNSMRLIKVDEAFINEMLNSMME